MNRGKSVVLVAVWCLQPRPSLDLTPPEIRFFQKIGFLLSFKNIK
jgi:hypothetical protein